MQPNEVRAAWQSQPSQMHPLTAERLRRKARRFRLERLGATFASVPIFGAFTLVFVAATIFGEIALCRIGCAIIAASFAYTAYRMVRATGRVSIPPPTALLTTACASSGDAISSEAFFIGAVLPAALGVALATLGWLRGRAEPMVRRGNRGNPREWVSKLRYGPTTALPPSYRKKSTCSTRLNYFYLATTPHPREARAP